MILVSILTIMITAIGGYLLSSKVCDSVYVRREFFAVLSDTSFIALLAFSSIVLVMIGLVAVIFNGLVGFSVLGFGFGSIKICL